MTVTKALRWYAKQHWALRAGVVGVSAVVGGVGLFFAAPVIGAGLSACGVGVAGGTLSGAAASSAGLAALGGGSLASGGLGVAGGKAILAVAGAVAAGTQSNLASRTACSRGEAAQRGIDEAEAQNGDDIDWS